MQIFIREKNKIRLNNFLKWLMYIIGYTLVFILVTNLFDSIYIDNNHFIIWSFIIVLVTSFLNQTIKPILVNLTIPITAMTLGLFYPCINAFILKIVDWLLGNHFQLNNVYILFFYAILLSLANFVVERIIKKILKKVQK